MYWYKAVPQYIALFLFVCFTSFLVFNWSTPVYSTAEQDIENEINQKTEELNKQKTYLSQIEIRIKEIGSSSYSLTEKIRLLNTEITNLQAQIDQRNLEIEEKLKAIDEKQQLLSLKKEYLDYVSSQLYMKTRYDGSQFLFSFTNLDQMLQSLFIKKSAIGILREDIEQITGEFENLVGLKASLEQEKADLDAQKKDLDESYSLVVAEKNKLQAELSKQMATKKNVTGTINGLSAELSDLQYQLLVVRQGGTNVSIDSVPASGDYNSTLAGFTANAPSGSFAIFSIGAYTHRNGMSQWGAKARAEAGQTYNQIIATYYPSGTMVTGYVEPASIRVKGTGTSCTCQVWEGGVCKSYAKYYDETIPFSTYMNRIYEMPASWSPEAVKAQAITARTYAIYKVNTQGYIIPNEDNQVSKDCDNASGWINAVSATGGVVLTINGAPYATQYAAVHGGWGNQVGWDTTDGSGSGDWMSRAWDRISNVSWFYKAWYRQTYSETSSTCGRYPWLSQAEMSDIVNAYQVWLAHNRTDSRIVPIYDACHSSGYPYSHAETFALAAKPVTSISAVVVSSTNGSSTTVTFYTNSGIISMSGNDFKTIYNLRAPGHLRIPQSGFVHINVHKK